MASGSGLIPKANWPIRDRNSALNERDGPDELKLNWRLGFYFFPTCWKRV